ncbi:MAG: hypothetical protein IIT60_08320 [Muribaculaceae bacterium]|nr:hypothetical protein [Muribaculaceae bacterium]
METTHAHISQLIERFMEGQSTLAEEQELAQYFATHEVSDEWKPLKDMFAYFDAGMPIEEPAVSVKVPITKHHWWWRAAAAAAVLLVGAITVFYILDGQPSVQKAPQYASNTPKSIPAQNTDTTRTPLPHAEPVKELVAEHKATKQVNQGQLAKPKTPSHDDAQRKQDSIEITRRQGEMELAQQELLADRIIMEQEREQMRREQMETRARLASTRDAMNYYNNQPQATMVVFK